MGKASRWFRGLLGLRKPDSSSPTLTSSATTPPKEKRRWSFVKSSRHTHSPTIAKPSVQNYAAVPAAALLTLSSTGISAGNRQEWAAIKIQAAFRGCLARRALRALKGVVKLQALVRGHIERKRTAKWLQRVQVLLQTPARTRTRRLSSSSIAKSSSIHLHGPATPDKYENPIRSKSLKYDQSSILKGNGSKSYVQMNGNGNQENCWNTTESWVDEKLWNGQRSSARTCSADDERSARSVEMDFGKPHLIPKRRARNLFQTSKDTTTYQSGPINSCEVQQCCRSLKPHEEEEEEEIPFCTAHNSPQFLSASSRDSGSKRSPFTPTKSDGSRSCLSGFSDCPSYMAWTESSKAKVRSVSAPRQRTLYERSGSSNCYTTRGLGESRLNSHRVSTLHASFTSKAYPGSGRLDKLGIPAGYRY